MQKIKIVGVFLSYYQDYLEDALVLFKDILNSLSGDFELIVVDNSQNNMTPAVDNDYVTIAGNNSAWEFSGWDRGIAYIREHCSYDSNTIFIFANDTVNKHRTFTWLDKRAFVSGFGKMPLDRPCICGAVNEINAEDKNITVYGMQTDKWVTTYLFAVNAKLFDLYEQFDQSAKFDAALVSCSREGFAFDSGAISDKLSRHLHNWLLPACPGSGWYGAGKIRAGDTVLLRNKLKAILSEKYLTAYCLANHGLVLDVYAGTLALFMIRVRARLNKWKRLISLK